MRSLWPAIGVCAFVAGCGRPNPGFKLIDSSDAGASDGLSASVGSTDSGPVTGAPTTSTDATGVQTASAGTTEGDPTAVSGSSTMGSGQWKFPTDCGADYLESDFTDAAADTFFLNEVAVNHCSFIPVEQMDVPDCQNMQFSLSGFFQLYLKADPNNPLGDYVGIYGVRFAEPMPMHEGIVIPKEAFLAVEARIHLFRPFPGIPWSGLQLDVRRFVGGDTWVAADGYDFTPCHAPAASFRCRSCPADGLAVEDKCSAEWGTPGLPYSPLELPLQKLNVAAEPNADVGADLSLLFATEDLPWLTSDGLMLRPSVDTEYGTIEVKTLEAGMPEWYPGLRVRYCAPVFVPD